MERDQYEYAHEKHIRIVSIYSLHLTNVILAQKHTTANELLDRDLGNQHNLPGTIRYQRR